MQLVKKKWKKGFQCLILVPEIILTSEWVNEIENDFGITPVIFHSSESKKESTNLEISHFRRNSIRLVMGHVLRYHFHLSNLGFYSN